MKSLLITHTGSLVLSIPVPSSAPDKGYLFPNANIRLLTQALVAACTLTGPAWRRGLASRRPADPSLQASRHRQGRNSPGTSDSGSAMLKTANGICACFGKTAGATRLGLRYSPSPWGPHRDPLGIYHYYAPEVNKLTLGATEAEPCRAGRGERWLKGRRRKRC